MSGGNSLTTKGLVSSGEGISYRMRGFDSTLGRLVFWTSPTIDNLGVDYTGPGPLFNVVIQNAGGRTVLLRETVVTPMLEIWSQLNVAASQTNVPLKAQVSSNFDDIKMMRPGSIVGLSTRLTEAISAGLLTVTVTKNGAPMTLSIVHSSGTGSVATQATGIDTYVANDLIGVRLTTNAGFLPNTTDLEAYIEIVETT